MRTARVLAVALKPQLQPQTAQGHQLGWPHCCLNLLALLLQEASRKPGQVLLSMKMPLEEWFHILGQTVCGPIHLRCEPRPACGVLALAATRLFGDLRLQVALNADVGDHPLLGFNPI